MLIFLAFAEASISAISSRRPPPETNDLSKKLRKYISQKQLILSSISVASTAILVSSTILASIQLSEISSVPSKAIIVIILVILSVTIIRQTARSLALINPEIIGGPLSKIIDVTILIFTPFVWALTRPVALISKAVGHNIGLIEPGPIDELLNLLAYQAKNDLISDEQRMILGVLKMNNQNARELMSPRTDVASIPKSSSLEDAIELISKSGYSRIPVYEDTLDKVIGILYAKDLLITQSEKDRHSKNSEIASIIRPPFFIPESRKADALLADFKTNQVHLGIVIDEYGGTAGVITVEDLLEEIVGEISDEYDANINEIERISSNELIVDASIPIEELKDILDINNFIGFNEDGEDFDSIGGLILTKLGRIAIPGDQVNIKTNAENVNLNLKVLSIRGHRIKRDKVTKIT
jgi:putative hemolysin